MAKNRDGQIRDEKKLRKTRDQIKLAEKDTKVRDAEFLQRKSAQVHRDLPRNESRVGK